MNRRRLRYLFILISAVIMLLAVTQVSFAAGEWNAESVTFTPAQNTIKMSSIRRADNDGPLKLDLAYRNGSSFNCCFFIKGDRCTVKYRDGSTKEFSFQSVMNPQFAKFKATDGSGEVIELEALSTDLSREIRGGVEGSADELAAIIGKNHLEIEYGVYDPDTGLGQRVVCDCTITVTEDKKHDCTEALRGRSQNDPTCEASGFARDCLFCQICGRFYTDNDAKHEIRKEDVYLPAVGHDWGEWETVGPVRCLERVTEKRTCKRDSRHSETREGGIAGHDWQLEKAEKVGDLTKETYKCGREGCGETFVLEYKGDKHFHDPLGYAPGVPATCTDPGVSDYGVCEKCGAKFKLTSGELQPMTDEEMAIPALGHDWSDWEPERNVTCTEKAVESRACMRGGCGYKEIRSTGEPLGHDWIRDVVIKQPTFTEEGIQSLKCARCGQTTEMSIPVLTIGTPCLNAEVKASKKTITVSWEPVSNATAVIVSYRKAGKAGWTTKTVTGGNSYKIKKLKNKGLYEIVAIGAAADGSRIMYGKESNIVRVYVSALSGTGAAGLKKSVRVSWKKDSKAAGYEIQYSTKKNMSGAATVTVSKKKSSCTIKNLRKGKRYYVRVRPLRRYQGGIYYGAYSAVRSAKAR